MDVVIGRPVVVRAEHRVSTDDLVEDLRARHDHPKLPVWVRMLRSTGVEWRPWSAPLEETAGRAGVGVRSRAAYEASRDRAVTAARDALVEAGLGPGEVDVLVTTHTTSWTIPGLDVDLVGRLGLRPDVERIGLGTAACVGGGHALVHAVRALRGRPGGRALVVAAEDISMLYHPDSGPPTMRSVLYGALFGDAAGAVVVSAVEEAGVGDLVVEDVARRCRVCAWDASPDRTYCWATALVRSSSTAPTSSALSRTSRGRPKTPTTTRSWSPTTKPQVTTKI
ncbi:hypothetical protein ACIGZI_31990 [Streptomyces griseus]|uniref:hypothetical protein n=1 Tax=Streptomyces griseus TaxID=1911 RepID=UPI0037D04A40